ncbi:MAG: hypothetical protein SFX18_01740 [Pirellulales bacterium]|nr:hypothetical protein [Pirellulales bacterium]
MRRLWLCLLLVTGLSAAQAPAQTRMQLPSQLPVNNGVNPTYSGSVPYNTAPYNTAPYNGAPTAVPNGYGAPAYSQPAYGAADPFATTAPSLNNGGFTTNPGAVSTRAAPPFVGSGSVPPGYTPPGVVQPGFGQPVYGQPGAVMAQPNGFSAGPPGTAPYYTPGGPQYLFPEGFPTMDIPQYQYSNEWTRLIQRIRASHGWIAGGDGVRDLGVNSTDTNVTFDIPLFNLPDHFLITPGFGLHLWDGPINTGPGAPDLPAQTYDAYLDVGWNPKFTNYFGAELGARVGVYTDFDHFSSNSLRVMGRGLGVVNLSPTLQFKLGVIYINRNDIKLLPAGGLIWDPSRDQHWEIFFPRPKIAWRLSTVGNFNLWMYVAGEYGGGAWTITRTSFDGTTEFNDDFDYNDLRVMLGFEWIPETKSGLSGFIEAGYVFNRELYYVSLVPERFDLADSFMIRGGFSF